MEKPKSKVLSSKNIDIWVSSLGISFPRTNTEEEIFNYLYKDFEHELTGEEIDPMKILKDCKEEEKAISIDISKGNMKMAARNFGSLPDHIIKKMKKNQDDKSNNNKKD